ncbi:MAG TPA: FHA domain-containing protein [Acidobacteriota bacterium]|jgi:hypothetical protein|nr:FHA domain-containing protein [Acidobacteriota bacterium]
MGILDKLHNVEKTIQKFIELQFGEEASREPLEVRREILEEVEDKIRTTGGKRAFPFNAIVVSLFGADPESRAVLQAAFIDTGQIASDIHQLLEGCEIPGELQIHVRIVGESKPELGQIDTAGFHIHYSRRVQKEKKKLAQVPSAFLTVLRGKAKRKNCKVNTPQTNIGRLREILDLSGRVVRRNDLAFLDLDDAVNSTVSRAHAHIYYESDTGGFRVSDDGSVYGTQLVRDGRTIEVPPGAHRGVKLRSGDKIHLGKVIVQFEIK